MPNYTCTKCDLAAHSKNVRTRSIFTEDREASMYSNLVKIQTKKKENGLRQVILTFPWVEYEGETPRKTNEELELEAFQMIQHMSPTVTQHLICEHDWVLVPNTGEEI